MKLLKYEKYGQDMIVSILFDDGTYNVTKVIDNSRPKEEIIKDGYIILKNAERYPYTEDTKDLEDLILPKPTPTFMEVDFYDFKGKVFDQYGEDIKTDITFEIQGTDKAKIENNKIIEQEVEEITSYFIVAKCGELEEKEERFIYPPAPVEPEKENPTDTLAKEVAKLKVDNMREKAINSNLGKEVTKLKIDVMKLQGGKL